MDNTARDHRLRVVFPTGFAEADVCLADAPYDVVARPIPVPDSTGWYEEAARTWPTKSLVSVGRADARLSVYHAGLSEYEVTDDAERAIALTLLRCFSTAGNPTETYRYQELAQCQGIHTFRYALDVAPGAPAALVRRALAFNVPLHALQTTRHAGTTPLSRSFLSVEPEAFVVTALKQAEDGGGFLLRGFNASDAPISARISCDFVLRRAEKVALSEEKIEKIAENTRQIEIKAGPKEIVSLYLTV